MLMVSGANFGLVRSAPHMTGVVIGFVVLLLSVGLGLAGLFAAWPALQGVLQVGGALYLLFLAWKIATARGLGGEAAGARPQTFWQAAAFQCINPKAWMIGVSAFSTFAPKAGYVPAVLVIVAVFAAVNVPCALTWTGFGMGLSRVLDRPVALRAFNIAMAVLLVASLYPLAAEWIARAPNGLQR